MKNRKRYISVSLLRVLPNKKKKGRGRNQLQVNENNPDAATIAHNIRRYRKIRGLTIQQASNLTTITPSQWYRIERATVKYRTPPDTLIQIANALRISVEKLKGKKYNIIFPTKGKINKIRRLAQISLSP